MVLATADANGVPMAHGMHYYPDGLRLYVSSLPFTKKLANIGENPMVGYTVYRMSASHEQSDKSRTLQVKALAAVVTDEAEITRVRLGLNGRYPWAAELQIDGNVLVVLDPIELLWMDMSKGFDGRCVITDF